MDIPYVLPVCAIKKDELRCPSCWRRILVDIALDEKDEAMYEANSFRDPALPYTVFGCSCGFTGQYDKFNGRLVIDEALKRFINDDLPDMLEIDGRDELVPSVMFRKAAAIAQRMGESQCGMGLLYLNAARCCLIAGDYLEDEPLYRRWSAEAFERAIETNGLLARFVPYYHLVVAAQYNRLGLHKQWQHALMCAKISAVDSFQKARIIQIIAKEKFNPKNVPEEDVYLQETDAPCC